MEKQAALGGIIRLGRFPMPTITTAARKFVRGTSLWLEEWDVFRYIPEEVTDCGERAFMRVRLSGRAKASGIKLDRVIFHVWTFRDGMPWRCDVFWDEEPALDAAGLSD
jgi:hypothetical protein